METLPPLDHPMKILPKTTHKSADNWAHQLFGQFPSLTSTTLTSEFTDGIIQILMLYPEAVLAVVCNPAYGIASKQTFFPSLAELKSACEAAANELAERERRAALPKAIPAKTHPDPLAGCYTGPIEQVKPGDILHHTRFDEYHQFMREKKNFTNTKLWGVNETWVDSGQRPFQLSAKPEEGDKEDQENPQPNPFDVP